MSASKCAKSSPCPGLKLDRNGNVQAFCGKATTARLFCQHCRQFEDMLQVAGLPNHWDWWNELQRTDDGRNREKMGECFWNLGHAPMPPRPHDQSGQTAPLPVWEIHATTQLGRVAHVLRVRSVCALCARWARLLLLLCFPPPPPHLTSIFSFFASPQSHPPSQTSLCSGCDGSLQLYEEDQG